MTNFTVVALKCGLTAQKNRETTRAGKNLGFLEIFFRFLRFFLRFFLGFLGFNLDEGFNVHNAEHRYMTHDK